MVQAGTLFGYLAAFITIVLAIAFGDLAISVHRLLRARRRVTWHPIPLLAAFWVMLFLLTTFFDLWDMTALTSMTFYELLWRIVPLFLFFLAASAILPDQIPTEGLDLYDFYLSERSYFLPVLMVTSVIDNASEAAQNWSYISAHPAVGWGFVLPLSLGMLVCLGVMLWRTEKWVHWVALAGLFGIAQIGFSGWNIEGASAIVG